VSQRGLERNTAGGRKGVWSLITLAINDTVLGWSLLALEMGKKPTSEIGAAMSDLTAVDGGMTGMVNL
jgi:hypothetical protein